MKPILVIIETLILIYKFFGIILSFKKNIFIYQMGKVGSQTIHKALKATNKFNVLHDHHYSSWQKKIRNKKYLDLRAMHLSNIFGKKIFIICPIRNPFKRNISMFFNQLISIPKLYGSISKKKMNYLFISNKFINQFDHEYAFNWIDFNILTSFNIDVYSKKFDKKKGFQTYDYKNTNKDLMKANHLENFINKNKNIKILVYKSELNNKKKKNIINKFLNENLKIDLSKINVTKDKKLLNKFYNHFIKTFKFPKKLRIKYEESKFYKKFY
jgi:hypothetical protein